MRKITKGKMTEKRMSTGWNASGSSLAVSRYSVDMETMVYAILCTMIVALILSATMPAICSAAGAATSTGGSGDGFSTLVSGFNDLTKNFYESLVVKVIGGAAGVALVIALGLRIAAPGSELDRRLHGWPMKIIIALVGVAIAPAVIAMLFKQLQSAKFLTFDPINNLSK